jgi:predicted O-methyltransferase YrrM
MEDMAYIACPATLYALDTRSKAAHFGMPSEPLLGALLRVLVASKPGGRFLELGTGTGISTSWILDGMDADSILVSLDNEAGMQQIAAEILGHDKRLTLLTEDGKAFLQKQPAQSFDLVFADALPGKYDGLEDALSVVKIGGFYVIDDMLPQPNWPEGHAEKIPILIERLSARRDFSILPLRWSSGVVIAVRIASNQ